MMGKDIERIITGIDNVKTTSSSAVKTLTGVICYHAMNDPVELLLPLPYITSIISAMSRLSPDGSKLMSLKGDLYTDASTFNNSSASPWSEFNNLQNAVDDVKSFVNNHMPMLRLIGEKIALLNLVQRVLTSSVDARWAIMHFHDYVQRGYDTKYNGNNPSITFAGSSKGDPSTGNINHSYDDNVHIPTPPVEVF